MDPGYQIQSTENKKTFSQENAVLNSDYSNSYQE